MSVQPAMIEAQRDNHVRAAMDRLLHELRRFMHACPMMETYSMPDHDLVWVDEYKDGPAQAILEAMKTSPELWVHALPEEVCIVPREMLKRAVRDDLICEALAHHGAHIVDAHAARARYEAEQKQEEARYRPPRTGETA